MKSIKTEEWKDIKGYEGLYQISNLGRVKSLPKVRDLYFRTDERILALSTHKGYLQVGLHKNNKRKLYRVHRLVAETFIPNPNNYKEVNHKDCNKQNNYIDNLEWCDRKYNVSYSKGNMKKQHNCKLPKVSNEKYIRYKNGSFEVTVHKKYYGRFKLLDDAISVRDKILESWVA